MQKACHIIEAEQDSMKRAGGATFGHNREYDKGYDAALADILILISKALTTKRRKQMAKKETNPNRKNGKANKKKPWRFDPVKRRLVR
jgi:hypothetical protein